MFLLGLSTFVFYKMFCVRRLKKQELASCAQSAEDVLRAVEESVKRELQSSMQSSLEVVADQPSKLNSERAKIVISIQDKDGPKQFRVYSVCFSTSHAKCIRLVEPSKN